MPRIAQLLSCALLLSAVSHAQAPDQAEAREARAKQATERRMAYAASKAYNPYDRELRDLEIEANRLLIADKFKEAMVVAEKGLKLNPCDIDLLIVMASACRSNGDAVQADQFRNEWISLVDSVVNSGTGRDPATAFKVISVGEEYAVIRAMGLKPVGQSLIGQNGSSFDVMRVKSPKADSEFELYFNVDLPMKAQAARLFAPAKK